MKKACKNCKHYIKKIVTKGTKTYTESDGLLSERNEVFGECIEQGKAIVSEDFSCPKWQGNMIFG